MILSQAAQRVLRVFELKPFYNFVKYFLPAFWQNYCTEDEKNEKFNWQNMKKHDELRRLAK